MTRQKWYDGIIILLQERLAGMVKAIGKLLKTLFTLIVIVVVLAGLLAGYAHFVEPKLLTTTHLTYHSSLIHKKITIAVFADTHFGFQYTTGDFQKAVNKINENPPDLLLFAGDLIDDLNRYNGDTREISGELASLKARLGKYAIFGNHDYGGGAQYKYQNMMAAGGFKVLVNRSVAFDRCNLRLIGIDDVLIGYGNPKVAQEAGAGMYNFVLCHEPDIADQLVGSHVNFMVAGHTHGGQIRVPFYSDKFLPSYGVKYVKGLYQVGDMKLYVNSGLGTTKIPARFRAWPEITYITLLPQN